MSDASYCSTWLPQVWLLSTAYLCAKAPSPNVCTPFAPSLRTGVKEVTDLHAPLTLRISTVGPRKQGSVTRADYLSELLESVPEHTHRPTHTSARAPPKPLIVAAQVFCLCPEGWAHWSPRFFEAIQTGCVPVLFPSDDGDSNELPFERLVDYASFVVYVRPARIATLQATLHAVAADRAGLRRRQRALWKYRSMLDWTDIGKEGAFHTLLSEVAARRAL